MAEPPPASHARPPRIRVQAEPFDVGAEFARVAGVPETGGIGAFVGTVRASPDAPALAALEIEHYAPMTEAAMTAIAHEAVARFGLVDCTLIHRVGRLSVGEPIVLVLATAPHRGAALEATRLLIDWLKTRAPLWKRELAADGTARWIEPRDADLAAAAGWELPASG